MSSSLAEKQNTGMVVHTPMDLMQVAIDKGVDVAALEKLMDLNDRYQASEAKKAFDVAMAAFQAQCPPVHKGKKADRYSYADIDLIMAVIRPILETHGLSIRFSTRISEHGMLIAICKVSHIQGHSEESEFSCPVDENMRVNDAQKQASANTYARRYALMNALNIVVTDEDDDGLTAGSVTITDEQVADLRSLIDEIGGDCEKRFLTWASKAAKRGIESVEDLPASGYAAAIRILEGQRK